MLLLLPCLLIRSRASPGPHGHGVRGTGFGSCTEVSCVQVILVVNQIYWCQEVEEAFKKMSSQKGAMAKYNKLQVQQLTDLIQVTRTDLKKEDRQKVMNMITIDAHSRDMVEQVHESGSDDVECFQWACQLRTYWDKSIEDCRIRICDASFPYGYEYLGNGPRLVITPLTDRIYITATQVRLRMLPLRALRYLRWAAD